ncbi:MAG: hypothetical protein V4494_03615 [Chlamydiota bacterium]
MKLYFYLERIVDYFIIYLISLSISLCLPTIYALIGAFALFIIGSLCLKKTPAMALFKRQFRDNPSFWQIVKTCLFMGEKKTIQNPRGLYRTVVVIGLSSIFILGGFLASTVNEFSSGFETHQKNAGWEYYISQDRGFTVQLPDSPSIETRQLYVAQADKTLNYNEYKSMGTHNTYYCVSFMDFPNRWRIVGSNKLLNTAFDILLKNEEGTKLVSKTSVQHKIYPAIEFIVKKGNEEMRGRLILVGNTFYKVMQVSSSSAQDNHQFEDFLSSFQFPEK